MRTFEVFLNKKRLCIAGIDADCVLSAIVDHVSKRRRLHLVLGGLDTSAGEHVRWVDRHLRVGDEIRIRIAEGSKADRPVKRFLRDRSAEVESKKNYVREYAKQLGWEIKESA
jgi:hypothetical protein